MYHFSSLLCIYRSDIWRLMRCRFHRQRLIGNIVISFSLTDPAYSKCVHGVVYEEITEQAANQRLSSPYHSVTSSSHSNN